ncbi:hypothetical protein EGK76_08245 [Luteimonas sp. 100069]|nr:hypothetical protein EGK76_08245 [Luteimonas sp. 100069]
MLEGTRLAHDVCVVDHALFEQRLIDWIEQRSHLRLADAHSSPPPRPQRQCACRADSLEALRGGHVSAADGRLATLEQKRSGQLLIRSEQAFRKLVSDTVDRIPMRVEGVELLKQCAALLNIDARMTQLSSQSRLGTAMSTTS